MRRLVPAVVWLAVCLAPSLAGQSGTAALAVQARDSTDTVVLDHDFISGTGEFVRVFLQAKQVYRAELSTTDVTLAIRSPLRQGDIPRVYP
ncbi:MAG: hypothetical protein H0T68_05945 [Gemmatimonadales bacterium]|nr:hypothetical protein [Gemmatimonadales bacterium]